VNAKKLATDKKKGKGLLTNPKTLRLFQQVSAVKDIVHCTRARLANRAPGEVHDHGLKLCADVLGLLAVPQGAYCLHSGDCFVRMLILRIFFIATSVLASPRGLSRFNIFCRSWEASLALKLDGHSCLGAFSAG